MSYKSHKTAPTRIFDHLYDPLYITSCTKDIWKANIQSLSQSAPFHIVPIYKTMFSDLPQRSRNIYLMQENPLPRPPTISLHKFEHSITKPADINGKHRANYFTHPLVTSNLNVSPHPRKQSNTISENNRQRSVLYSLPIIESQTFKTVACQTVYREQSAQTRSWMPLATINQDTTLSMETSEIVHISNVLQNDDDDDGDAVDEDGNNMQLPDIFQIKIIERSRKRREWERSLPPIKTIRDWNKRRCLMEAFEWEEWIAREEEIDHYQNVRLLMVKEMMDERTENHENANALKMDNTKNRHMADRDRKFVKLRNIHRRCTRKLEKKHQKINTNYANGNVNVKEYIVDKTSKLHEPQDHFQYHPKNSHFIDEYDSKRTNLLNNIHTKIPMNGLDSIVKQQKSIDITKPKIPIQEIQQGFCQENALADLYNTLKALRNQKIVNQDIIKCLKYIKLPITDPSDIQLDINRVQYEQEQDKEYQNALLLQKLIKGRASQTAIFNGRNKCKSLILEYQSAHQLDTVSALYPKKELNKISEKHKCVLYQQSRLAGLLRAEAQINDVLQSATGSSFSFLLNFLDTELTRLIEQKKGHALYLLAERERQQREAIEEQERQREEHHRQEITEFLEKKINSTSETVTMYLENILLESIERISDCDARQHIRNVAKEIDQITARSMDSRAYDRNTCIPNDEEIISDLVNNFMFPEIYQRIARRDSTLKKHSALFAAHSVIYDDLKNVYPIRERFIENNEIIATAMVNEIINDILPASSSMDDVTNSENTDSIRHNNNKNICEEQHYKKPTFKTSHELIVNATISDILKNVIPGERCTCDIPNNKSSSDNQKSLKAIANEINEELYNYAIDTDDDERNATDKNLNL